ncbi:MAG: fibrillarin-like rRNA/tRNA 2'-O-methyltransferase, partial [Candidatus Bathyarchaeia archaeon]
MSVKVEPIPQFDGVYQVTLEDGSKRIASKNLAPGRDVYGERLIRYKDVEYRLWDPYRSKIAAAILKGLKAMPIKPGHKVLYLGAASGTTASHVSDIVGEEGHVYCIEFAPRPLKELINNVCRYRPNMSPILADARFPEKYAYLIEKVDVIYCDIAQPEQ